MPENENKRKGMLKNEYAKKIGIPCSTLRRYMNQLYFTELMLLDYSKGQNYLTPRQIAFLDKKLVVSD